jgi:hypothetical protein
VDGVYLECRLAATVDAVDVVVRVPRESADILADTNPAIALHAAGPEWQAVRTLAREWVDPRTTVARAVDHLWLEFDLPPATALQAPAAIAASPAPSVFLAFDLAVTRPLGPRALADTIRRTLGPLGAESLPPETWPSLRRALEALPPGTAVPYVGVMLARGGGSCTPSAGPAAHAR